MECEMTKWEYHTQPGHFPSALDFKNMLQRLGNEGWELVGTVQDRVVFKRPKSDYIPPVDGETFR